MVAFQYLMSHDQSTKFLEQSEHFSILPTSIIFFCIISCFSLLFNNLATGLMSDIRENGKEQWVQDHSDTQLFELAANIEDCKSIGHFYSTFLHLPLIKKFAALTGLLNVEMQGPFQKYDDQYYVLSWVQLVEEEVRCRVMRCMSEMSRDALYE